jgi:AAA15 family ATPase/GTPase
MRLVKFSYKQKNWELDEITFNDVNLIVGKNAAGKSRIINRLNEVVELINPTSSFRSISQIFINTSFSIELKSKDEEHTIKYNLSTRNRIIVEENLWYDGELYLERNTYLTKIWSASSPETEVEINPPGDSLVLLIRRDTKEYPFFEQIILWAENCYGMKFGEISNQKIYDTSHLFHATDSIIDMYESLDENSRNNIIKNLSSIDFKVSNIIYRGYPLSSNLSSPKDKFVISFLYIEEDEVGTFDIKNLSQGMYRTLCTLIFMEYLLAKKEPQTIIIDDLCEGLDYSRATKLGKLLFEFCKKHNIQLIASSNDGFLMDAVNLEYWNVLQRDGKKVSTINYANSPELFDDFKFTGFSNFDFFSSDYIAKNKK